MIGAGTGGQGPPDGADGEEAERCPICLGILAGGELAMPDSCCHVFCLRCLLTWAELQMAPSCPVDRRPFNNVYRWDRILGCVQVPVRKRLPQSDAESCCCRNPEQKACLKSKPTRRLRRQKVERTADAKTKGLVRKCNDEDPSSLSRKKVRGIECCTWSPPLCVSSVASSQDVADPVWLAEDIPYDTGFKQCKPQVQLCPWLSPAAPIPADGTSRQSFHGTSWNHNPFPFGFVSSPFTSSSPFSPSHFVFQGVVCAITCPKGGEKRGGRASTSKAPTKETEPLPSRRSGRNSKTQEETPASDPATPPQSSLSDSDSSASQSTKLAKTSQVPAKRKGKRVTNRKASGKRKATARKKSSPEVVDSPAASEEEAQEETQEETQEEAQEETQEEESDGSQNREEKEEEEDKTEQELDGTEGSLSDEQDGFKSSDEQEGVGPVKDVGQESEETQEQIDERIQEEKADEGESDVSCPSGSAVSSPGSCSEEVKSNEEAEEQASPVSSGEKHPEKRTSPPPPDSQNSLLEDTMSPQCEELDDKMDICAESEEADNEESSKEVKAESCGSLAQPGSPSAGELEKNVADQEATASEVIVAEMPASLEPSGVDSSVEGSKDDTSVVPMDCSSPMSEHGNSPVLELPNEIASPASAEPPPTTSETHVVKEESAKDKRERERSQERKNGKQRRSRFHSPTSTWSPKRDSKRETSRRSRSRSRERDGSPPSRRSSRTRSRERDRDRDGERDYSRRDRSRERRRRRSRSRSWSRSRSRSRSRTRSHRRGPSPEWPVSRDQSPQRKERRGGWRSGPGSGSGSEGRRYHGGAGHFENGVPTESSPDRQGSSDNPDWVTEKIRGEADGRNRDFGYSGSSRWEDRSGNRGEPRGRGGRGGFERGRGGGRGSGNRSFYNQQEEMSDNRWQPRNNFSGTGNNSGNDAYSRFNENRGGGRRKESEPGEPMLDRSGWSSASSWAVRRTLPADVQDYYSKRERGPGSWNRQEEEQQPQPAAAAADPPKSDPPLQAVPGNAPVPLMNVIPPQLNVLHHYPLQGPRGALPVSLQPAAPYAMPPQVPIHLHPAVPLLQVPAVGAQGLPPPPPPPPPMQQGSQTAAVQPDGHAAQMPNTMVSFVKPALLPNPTKAGVAAVTQGQPAPSQALPSSTTQPGQHNKAQADSSKKEKKQQIQEKAINEVKTAIKPFYQKKEITKEEYKEIVRKAVEKVCHSKSGEVNSGKVANLVKAYVDKYKHARKK